MKRMSSNGVDPADEAAAGGNQAASNRAKSESGSPAAKNPRLRGEELDVKPEEWIDRLAEQIELWAFENHHEAVQRVMIMLIDGETADYKLEDIYEALIRFATNCGQPWAGKSPALPDCLGPMGRCALAKEVLKELWNALIDETEGETADVAHVALTGLERTLMSRAFLD